MRYELNKQAPRALKAPTVTLNVAGTIYYSGIDAATLKAAVDEALLEFIRTVPPGGEHFDPYISGVVRFDQILDAIKTTLVNGVAYVRTITLTSPTTDFPVSTFGKVILGATPPIGSYLLINN